MKLLLVLTSMFLYLLCSCPAMAMIEGKWIQNDWSGDGGQLFWSDTSKYNIGNDITISGNLTLSYE